MTSTSSENDAERELAFSHGVASGDPLTDRTIIWSRVTPLAGPPTTHTPRQPDSTPAITLIQTGGQERLFCQPSWVSSDKTRNLPCPALPPQRAGPPPAN
ncbi:hypothetical protein CK507_17330 [Pseudomonas sp. WN033]|nr:hypothetical protein CK507_17330 [Pseudomonas sp. WN033]